MITNINPKPGDIVWVSRDLQVQILPARRTEPTRERTPPDDEHAVEIEVDGRIERGALAEAVIKALGVNPARRVERAGRPERKGRPMRSCRRCRLRVIDHEVESQRFCGLCQDRMAEDAAERKAEQELLRQALQVSYARRLRDGFAMIEAVEDGVWP